MSDYVTRTPTEQELREHEVRMERFRAEREFREEQKAKHVAAGLCVEAVKPSGRVAWLSVRYCPRRATHGQYCKQHAKIAAKETA